ncbi:hypothetical protein EV44_g3806 [Erysiphe necator]|uniref:Chromo domain-containing protein n=1 Tax=Uncinula necator TaxID=52586 RepID=A0A0B1P8X3_UNCNE|nr:hypothetical protein EV44_g3806 [Erysiphe necator]
MAMTLKNFADTARESLKRTQERMVKQANKHRGEPDFGIGDKVFIVKKSWSSTDRPSDKLDFPLTRLSYKIKAMREYSYELGLPENWRMSRLFYADRLRKDSNKPLPGQEYERLNPDIVDGEEEWEVENILSSRIYYGKLHYMVQWRGWDTDSEYCNAHNFINAPFKIREFHEQNPDCEGPPARLKNWERAFANDEILTSLKDDNKLANPLKGLIIPHSRK